MSRLEIYAGVAAALDGLLCHGMTLKAGGFGLSGNPEHLIPALNASGVRLREEDRAAHAPGAIDPAGTGEELR